MNKISRKVFLSSLTSLTVMASSLAFAEEMVTAPSFEGGLTASIGTFLVVPSAESSTAYAESDFEPSEEIFVTLYNADPDYGWGYDASLGYLFEGTANGIELQYRGLDNETSSHLADITDPDNEYGATSGSAENKLRYTLNAADLLISQYMDIGTHFQVRINGGLSYLDLEQKQNITSNYYDDESTEFVGSSSLEEKSKFTGWGPRVGMDGRYDFGEEIAGFGIIGGASLGYYLGSIDLTGTASSTGDARAREEYSIYRSILPAAEFSSTGTDKLDSQNVTNLRANLGIDYVYFFDNEERSTLGLELGYLVDFYDNAVANLNNISAADGEEPVFASVDTESVTFSGPYLTLKGVF